MKQVNDWRSWCEDLSEACFDDEQVVIYLKSGNKLIAYNNDELDDICIAYTDEPSDTILILRQGAPYSFILTESIIAVSIEQKKSGRKFTRDISEIRDDLAELFNEKGIQFTKTTIKQHLVYDLHYTNMDALFAIDSAINNDILKYDNSTRKYSMPPQKIIGGQSGRIDGLLHHSKVAVNPFETHSDE